MRAYASVGKEHRHHGIMVEGVDVVRPQPLAAARLRWQQVERVLVVRLRSIGDTVLATPALYALRRFLPQARIDILLEDWVAPVLAGNTDVDNVLTIKRGSTRSRAKIVRELRRTRYDVAFNLHGGTTATLLTRATGAVHRVGYNFYQYARLHNHQAPSAAEIWGRPDTHSVENQLALLGWCGVPVTDLPPTRLAVTPEAAASIALKLRALSLDESCSGNANGNIVNNSINNGANCATPFVLLHPAAAFASKQWAVEHFAGLAEDLQRRGLACVAIAAPHESEIVRALVASSAARINVFTDLTLPEVVALAARARLFVGNDSGIAHMAAAVNTPSVVIFGSSSVARWRPWTTAPTEVVREEMVCAPCPGYTCAQFAAPECIRRVPLERVKQAVMRVLSQSADRRIS